MKKLVLAPSVTRRRHSRYVLPVLAALLGIGSGSGLAAPGAALADEETVAPADGAVTPIIVTKSMKAQALKDAAAGVRGGAPAARAAPAAATSGTPTSPPPDEQQPAQGAGASK